MAFQEVSTAQLAADAAAILPPREVAAKIYEHCAVMANVETKIASLEAELESLRDDHRTLATRTLPDLFDHLHTDRLGVPGWNADVVLTTKTHAAIKEDFTEEQRAAAFAELERVGGGDLAKHVVSVQFGKDESELAAKFVRMIRGLNILGGRMVSVHKTVHWATLSSFVRAKLGEPGVKIDLTALGATVVRECKIVWRKSK